MNTITKVNTLFVFGLLVLSAFCFPSCSKIQATSETERPAELSFWDKHKTPHKYDLAVKHDGEYYFLSESDFAGLDAEKLNQIEKIGVFMDYKNIDNTQFIVALNDLENGKLFTVREAQERYLDVLPTDSYTQNWEKDITRLAKVLKAYGGTEIEKTAYCTRKGIYGPLPSDPWNMNIDNLKGRIRPVIHYLNPFLNEDRSQSAHIR